MTGHAWVKLSGGDTHYVCSVCGAEEWFSRSMSGQLVVIYIPPCAVA